MSNTTRYHYPAVTVDLLVFTVRAGTLQILLVKRAIEPFKGLWALPGGFVRTGESLEAAAARELAEEGGLVGIHLEQLSTFGAPDRDPRGRVITVAYLALVNSDRLLPKASTDVSEAAWFSTKELPKLAFDHRSIVDCGLERLRGKLGYTNIAFALLPDEFRLSELQQVYEAILAHPLDKRNFRKWVQHSGVLLPTRKVVRHGAHRPARLFRFKARELVYFE